MVERNKDPKVREQQREISRRTSHRKAVRRRALRSLFEWNLRGGVQ
jgi:hypothetical protein